MANKIDQMLYKKFGGDSERYYDFISGWRETVALVKKGAAKRGIDLKDIPIVVEVEDGK